MKKLFDQIIKFGLVGALSFVIDFLITMIGAKCLRQTGMETGNAAMLAAFFGFVISVVVNYILSMKFVFVRKSDLDRRKEFIIFVALSVVGLIINELLIKAGVEISCAYAKTFYDKHPSIITAGSKVFATGVVMVYNFVTRKIFLENKEK